MQRIKKYILKSVLFFVFYFLLFVSQSVSAQKDSSVKADASFDKAEITIGDKVKYTITVQADKDTKIKFPVIDNILTKLGFAVNDFGKSKRVKISRKRIRERRWYLLDTYVTGSYTVPSVKIKYTLPNGIEGEAKTQEIFLNVKSVIKKGEKAEDIKDIKAPVGIKISYKKIIIWVTGILILILAISIGIPLYLRHRQIKPSSIHLLPAHIIALRDLEKARQMPLETEWQIKAYYTSVSSVIRHYIENRFNFHALEQTTEEFLANLALTTGIEHVLSKAHKRLLRDFLKNTDMVKFAKYGPTKEEIENVYSTGKGFIEETKNSGEKTDLIV